MIITGIFDNGDCYKKFRLVLDRDTDNKNVMIAKYNKIFEIFNDLGDDQKCPIIDKYVIG